MSEPNPNWGPGVWDEKYATQVEWQSAPSPHVVDVLTGVAPGSVLDVACGIGRNTVWLASQGWDAHGVDFSHVALERAGELAETSGVQATFHCGDVVAGWQPDRQFDLVMLSYLHYRDHGIKRVIDRMVDWVAPGGALLVTGFDESSHPLATGPGEKHQLYTTDLLGDVMAAGGLEVVLADVRPRTLVDETGAGVTVRDAVVMAKRLV